MTNFSTCKPSARWNWGLIPALILTILFAGGCSLFAPKPDPSDPDYTYPENVTVNGVLLTGMTIDDAKSALEKQEDEISNEYLIKIICGDEILELCNETLSITFDTEEILSLAAQESSVRENTQTPLTYEITPEIDQEAAKQTVTEFLETFIKEPIEPEGIDFDFDSKTFSLKGEEKGISVDLDQAVSDLMALLKESRQGSVHVKTEEIGFQKDWDAILACMGQIGTFSTECTNTADAAHNMELAMNKMNGHTINPGEIFSFHEAVGDSTTAEGGWALGNGWMGGQLVPMYGGGICQAATTFYNCALLSNMEIVERWEHMQPSTYCDPGLDATVSYGSLDTRMKNISDYPIFIVSGMEIMF